MIGDLIKTERKKRGITQQELANRINTNIRNIQRYESNEVKPRKGILEKIAKELGLNPFKISLLSEYNIEKIDFLFFNKTFNNFEEVQPLFEKVERLIYEIDNLEDSYLKKKILLSFNEWINILLEFIKLLETSKNHFNEYENLKEYINSIKDSEEKSFEFSSWSLKLIHDQIWKLQKEILNLLQQIGKLTLDLDIKEGDLMDGFNEFLKYTSNNEE